MGEIEDIHHPEDEGQAGGDEKKKPCIDQSVKNEDGNDIHCLIFPIQSFDDFGYS